MKKKLTQLDIEAIKIIDSLDSVVALKKYLAEIELPSEQLRCLRALNSRINSPSISIIRLYPLYFYRKYELKEKGEINMFDESHPLLGKRLDWHPDLDIAFLLKKCQLKELMNLVPSQIEEIKSYGVGKNLFKNLLKNRTFCTTFSNRQLSILRAKLIKGYELIKDKKSIEYKFISNEIEEKEFYCIFNGNPERIKIQPIHWIAKSPTRDDHYSTPLLLTFIELLVKYRFLDKNFFKQNKRITNGLISKCFRIGAEAKRLQINKVRSNIKSFREPIPKHIEFLESILEDF